MATQMTKVEAKGMGANRKVLGLGLPVVSVGLAVLITLGVIERGGVGELVNPAVEPAIQPDESILNNYRSFRNEAAGIAEEQSNLSPEVLKGQGAVEPQYPRMSATPWEYNHGP